MDPSKLKLMFKVRKGTYLSGYNNKFIRGTATVEKCMKACIEETSFYCKSFDFYDKKNCALSA